MRFTDIYGSAKFIAPSDSSCESPYIRKVIEIGKAESAKITICGLGFFELFINGRRVSDDVFVPANSLYNYRSNSRMNYFNRDVFTYRTYSVVYDVKDYLKEGKNTVVVHLGNGWYGETGNQDERVDAFGKPKLVYKLEITDTEGDKLFVSDETHKWRPSFITQNRLYLGEHQDLRLYDNMIFRTGYDDSEWEEVTVVDAHECEYDIQDFEPDRITETRVPVAVKDFGDYTVYDCGINMTGYVVVECEKAGQTIEINYAEEIHEDCTLNVITCAGDRKPQKDVYISDGVHEMYPRFSWHGFRYFTLTNNAKPVKACMVHADINVTSHFESDNENLNWLYEAYVRTQLENMHCGVPSDCPTRERLGYTGDGQLCADAALLMMDGKKFYKKWMQDIVDSQCAVSGHVNHTTPYMGGGGGIGGWGCAIIHVPYVYYKIYGDDSLVKEHFPRMLSFMRYLDSRCSAGFITHEEKQNWNLGDWGFSKQHEYIVPQNFVNTYFYVRSLNEMMEMCTLVGQEDLITSYSEKVEISKRAMRAAYLSSQDGNFFGNYQGANAFALDLGIGDHRTYKNTCEKYAKTREYDTGIFATDILTGLFFKNGNAQIAFDLLTSENDVSFGNMKKNGATTIWEYMWGPIAAGMSHNHPMFGAVTRFLFEGFLGITQREGTAGFTDLIIDPALVRGMNKFSGYINVGKGKIGVSVECGKTNTMYKITIPEGVKAVFKFEANDYVLKAGENEFDMQLIQ